MNLVFILIDSLRRDHLGCYGNDWIQTPNIDHLATESVVFDNAYLASFPCMPARRDIWTGRYEFPWRGWGPLEHDDLNLARLVSAHDHVSMFISDHYHMWERGAGNYHFNFSGAEFVRGQENDLWITDPTIPIEYPADPARLAKHALRPGSFERYKRNTAHFRTESDYFAPQVFQKAMDWVERNHSHDDFFLMIECFDPHEPFDPPYPYNQMYDPDYTGQSFIWPTYGESIYSDQELDHIRALYAGEVTLVDRWLGLFLDKVRQLELMENTMIVLVTDHGHLFGEHNLVGKPWSDLANSNMYQELAHIPLMIYHPQQAEAGKRIPHLVQPVDLFPTVLDSFGIETPAGTHGHSLLPYVLEPGKGAPVREIACFGRYGEAINVTDGEWTLFQWPPTEKNEPLYWYSALPPQFGDVWVTGEFDGVRYPARVTRGEMASALYNVKNDYAQQHDLYHQEPEVVARLRQRMRQFLRSIDAPPEQLTRLGLEIDS